jgi:hypothetical protein
VVVADPIVLDRVYSSFQVQPLSRWTEDEKMASLVRSLTRSLRTNGSRIKCKRLRPSCSWTLLHGFAATGNEIAVRWLLDDDTSDLVEAEEKGHTPLHVAAMHGNDVVVQTLLEYGARVETKDELGQTPLHLAALGRSKRCAQLLLANDANPHAKDYRDYTPADLCSADKEMNALMTEAMRRDSRSKALRKVEPAGVRHVSPQLGLLFCPPSPPPPRHLGLTWAESQMNARGMIAKEALGVLKDLI